MIGFVNAATFRAFALLLFATVPGWGLAQPLVGTFNSESPLGTTTMTVSQQGTTVTGSLSGAASARFQGEWDGTVAVGNFTLTADGSSVDFAFALEPTATGVLLGLAEYRPNSREPNTDTLTVFEYQRVQGAASSPPAAAPGNPLSPDQPPQPLAGSYSDGQVGLTLEGDGIDFSGTLSVSGQAFQVSARLQGGELIGQFGSGFGFSARLDGEVLVLTSDGASYRLARQGGPPARALTPATPPTTTAAPSGTQIEIGTSYPGGSQVHSGAAGVSLTVPQGFTGAYAPDEGLFTMASTSQPVLITLAAYSQATLEGLLAYVNTLLAEDQAQLIPQGQPLQTPGGFRGGYLVTGDGETLFMHVSAQQGADGNGVAVLALGPVQVQAAVKTAATQVIDSVRFGAPAPPDPASQQQLAGTNLHSSSSDSLFSQGGAAPGGSATRFETDIHLCRNGQYGYLHQYDSIASIPDVSAQLSDSDQHAGSWSLVWGFAGEQVLALQASDGRAFYLSLGAAQQQGRLFLNGSPYTVGQSRQCL